MNVRFLEYRFKIVLTVSMNEIFEDKIVDVSVYIREGPLYFMVY